MPKVNYRDPEKDHDDDPDGAPIVTCVVCKREYTGFSHDQAYDCAADITPTGVQGHYGSSVADMTQLRFVPDHPDIPQGITDGQICDSCIVDLQERGALTEVEQEISNQAPQEISELFSDGPTSSDRPLS